jgi:hypothetical protein
MAQDLDMETERLVAPAFGQNLGSVYLEMNKYEFV